MLKSISIFLALLLAGCGSTLDILDGATHACGILHVEGYFTDSQGEVLVVKAPSDWTPEQILQFCPAQ